MFGDRRTEELELIWKKTHGGLIALLYRLLPDGTKETHSVLAEVRTEHLSLPLRQPARYPIPNYVQFNSANYE